MDSKSLNKLKDLDFNNVGRTIIEGLRKQLCAPDIYGGSLAVAYVFYLAKEKGYDELNDPESFIKNEIEDRQISFFVRNEIAFGWEEISSLYNQFDADILKAYILFSNEFAGKYGSYEPTPISLCKLASRLLDIHPEETVVDFGVGRGNFLVEAYSTCPTATYYGNDINTDAYTIAYIRATLLGDNVTVKQEDMFNTSIDDKRFDKVFSNYPFGIRLRDLRGGQEFLEQISNQFLNMTQATSSDWVFNTLLFSRLNMGGKAVGIMTNGSTWNSLDKPIREFFIRKGYVECVIALPDRLFDYSSIPTTMIVFSHGNKSVRMIDARELCEKGRRQNALRQEDIEAIIRSNAEDSTVSKNVSLEEIADNDFVLSPIRYFAEDIVVENGVPLENFVKRITRGAPCTASELDQIVSQEPTSMQYLMLSNINDGIVDESLPYLTHIEQRYEKYCLNDNALLLSKNGYPFKVAVAHVESGEKILANGNLYIIDLDETKINPYYLKAYLESEQGIAALKGIAVGATIPNIAVEQLRKLMIPLMSLAQQEKIAERYLATLDEIAVLKLKIAKAKSSLKNIMDAEKE